MGATQGYAYEGVFVENYKKWSKRRIRNYSDFKPGDAIIYCNCPLPSGNVKCNPTSNVDVVPASLIEYEGKVIQKTPYTITIEILPREGQIAGYSKPIPYKVSLQNVDVGVIDLLRRVSE